MATTLRGIMFRVRKGLVVNRCVFQSVYIVVLRETYIAGRTAMASLRRTNNLAYILSRSMPIRHLIPTLATNIKICILLFLYCVIYPPGLVLFWHCLWLHSPAAFVPSFVMSEQMIRLLSNLYMRKHLVFIT